MVALDLPVNDVVHGDVVLERLVEADAEEDVHEHGLVPLVEANALAELCDGLLRARQPAVLGGLGARVVLGDVLDAGADLGRDQGPGAQLAGLAGHDGQHTLEGLLLLRGAADDIQDQLGAVLAVGVGVDDRPERHVPPGAPGGGGGLTGVVHGVEVGVVRGGAGGDGRRHRLHDERVAAPAGAAGVEGVAHPADGAAAPGQVEDLGGDNVDLVGRHGQRLRAPVGGHRVVGVARNEPLAGKRVGEDALGAVDLLDGVRPLGGAGSHNAVLSVVNVW